MNLKVRCTICAVKYRCFKTLVLLSPPYWAFINSCNVCTIHVLHFKACYIDKSFGCMKLYGDRQKSFCNNILSTFGDHSLSIRNIVWIDNAAFSLKGHTNKYNCLSKAPKPMYEKITIKCTICFTIERFISQSSSPDCSLPNDIVSCFLDMLRNVVYLWFVMWWILCHPKEWCCIHFC
jgi:hypothetical protein